MRSLPPLALALCVASSAPAALQIELVTVGDPGNPDDEVIGCDILRPGPDGRTSCGRVDHVFQIGKFEIVNLEYAEFLNAVARDGDPHGLWDLGMLDLFNFGGIRRDGATGPGDPNPPFDYVLLAGERLHAVNFVSWYDAARFVNWLENGQPTWDQIGDPDAVTESGTYDMSIPCDFDPSLRCPTANPNALWALPTIDEWHKAAYYDPVGLAPSGYWTYPMRSDTVVCHNPPPADSDPVGSELWANCDSPGGVFDEGRGPQKRGIYRLAVSHYGTFDQGGSVSEWTEEIFEITPNPFLPAGVYGHRKGGSYETLIATDDRLRSDADPFGLADAARRRIGFRVVFLPEPAPRSARGAALASVALLAALARRRRDPIQRFM